MHQRHETASSGRAEALLQGCYIRRGILKNDFAADQVAWRHSCRCPRVHLADSTAFPADFVSQELARKNVPASHGNRAAPRAQRSREISRCGYNEVVLSR